MISPSSQNSFQLEMHKQFHALENHKILKAIHNKMTPLNMSPKVKRSIQRQKQAARPTFNEFSHHKSNLMNYIKNKGQITQRRIDKNQELFDFIDCPTVSKNTKVCVKKIKLKQNKFAENQTVYEIEKMKIQRLPSIKKNVQKKKQQLAKNIQNDSIQFHNDKFRPLDQQKIYNLEYIMNRLNIHQVQGWDQVKKKQRNRKNQPLRGYENLSPNKLNEYIEFFQKKIKTQPQSIYISKKRIALPRSNTQGQEQEKNNVIRFKSIASTKEHKSNINTRKQLNGTNKNFCNQIGTKLDIKKAFPQKKSNK